MRKILAVLLMVTILVAVFPMMVMADSEQKRYEFTDVDKDNWAYESIRRVVEAGIMDKDARGRFNPGAIVSRGDFAVLMVKVLDLPLINPQQGTFLDVPKTSKYYQYAETAKYYLTAYRTTQGDSFRPEEASVREDIAVALVKALGYMPSANYNTILKDYRDVDEISPNLRSYVASVVENKIMIGTGKAEKRFSPQLKLTRAEVAQLIFNLILVEKITYDDEDKVTYEQEPTPTPTAAPTPTPTPTPVPETVYTPGVSVSVVNNGLKIDWTKTPSDGFSYYKVVMSKSDSTPSYPDNGYVAVISDNSMTSCTVTAGQGYSGGDVGTVTAGQKYYITITAVYNHGNYTGNVVRKAVPQAETIDEGSFTPKVSAQVTDEGLKVKWTKTKSGDFSYYKVVMSKSDSSPSYPDDGYVAVISDINTTSFTITAGQGYNGGDVGMVTAGQKYYITITAVYNHGKYTGNVLHKSVPQTEAVDESSYTPVVTVQASDNCLRVDWTKTPGENFSYYKVVMSKSDSSPSYPDNGYITYISDANQTSYTICPGADYNGGDVDKVEAGQEYYITVTAVYGHGKYTGNVVQKTMP